MEKDKLAVEGGKPAVRALGPYPPVIVVIDWRYTAEDCNAIAGGINKVLRGIV